MPGLFLGLFSTTTKSLLQCSHFAVAKRIVLPGQSRGVRFWQCGHSNSCLSNPGVIFGTLDFDESGFIIATVLLTVGTLGYKRVRAGRSRELPRVALPFFDAAAHNFIALAGGFLQVGPVGDMHFGSLRSIEVLSDFAGNRHPRGAAEEC